MGRGVYSLSRQRVTSGLNGHRARTVGFSVRLRNRGNVMDRITIRATRGSAQFRVAYLQGRTNVTARVLAGRYRSGSLRPGRAVVLTVRVTKVTGARTGSHRAFTVRGLSVHDRRKVDAVAAVVKVFHG